MLTRANCLLVVVHMSWIVLISYFLVFARNTPSEISEVKVTLFFSVVVFSVSDSLINDDDSIEGGDAQYDR